MKIKLEQAIDAIASSSDEIQEFYDTETGKTAILLDPLDEEDQELSELIESTEGRFIKFPEQYEIHEFRIMEDFIDTLPPGEMRDDLIWVIRGKKSYRRFKDSVNYYGIEQSWYDFRDKAYRKIAISWCEDHNLDYEE